MADLAGPVLLLALIGWAGGAPWSRRRARRPRRPATDEPAGTPYRIHTAAFDRTVPAREAPALLAAADRHLPPGEPPAVTGWADRVAAADRWAVDRQAALDRAELRLRPVLDALRGRAAATLLIDQSGSMRDRMIAVAAAVRWLSAAFVRAGVPLGIAGFTTLGWRGGTARRAWEGAGRPTRPGRLCALLHLVYQDMGEPLADPDWRAMLHPDALRENIDGEALAWAAGLLAARPEPVKLLVVLSDGAPVDDSTLFENGPSYLMRHLRAVVAGLADCGISLGGVGIEYDVASLYPGAALAASLDDLPEKLVEQVAVLAANG